MMRKRVVIFSFFFAAIAVNFITIAFASNQNNLIIQKPIIFNETRIQLTKDYLYHHYGIHADTIDIIPKMIVLHWTGQAKLSNSFRTFEKPTVTRYERPDLPDNLNVSVHFLIDRDGKIYQLMPETWMARHVIGLNYYAIGVENVGGGGSHLPLTEAQVEANAYLVCYLVKKYKTIEYLIGHQDYREFRGTAFWLEKNPHYVNRKDDPGRGFMREVVKRLRCGVKTQAPS